jgi:transcriptional regulator with XRE-family HTH domain
LHPRVVWRRPPLSRADRQVLDYGARFKQIRKARWNGTVLQLAKKLGTDYPSSIYHIERAWRVPQLRTIQKHATALGCDPWELLQDVETEYDRARALATLPLQAAMVGWHQLLTRHDKNDRARESTEARGTSSVGGALERLELALTERRQAFDRELSRRAAGAHDTPEPVPPRKPRPLR